MMRFLIIFGATIGAAVIACSNHGGSQTDAPPAQGDAPRADASTSDARMIDAAPGTVALTVKNYLSWCTVQVGSNGTFTTTTPQVVNVMPGVVDLAAKPASATFELGSDMWHHVDGTTGDTGIAGMQTGTGLNATSKARVTVSTTSKCVWVCCPFAATGSGCDPAMIGDQCP